jgi:hypothetical protein
MIAERIDPVLCNAGAPQPLCRKHGPGKDVVYMKLISQIDERIEDRQEWKQPPVAVVEIG